MTVFLSPVGGAGAQFFDNNGNPLSGGKLYTYSAGTTTPQATYTSSSGAAFHTNPIVLDSAGRVPGSSEIWLSDGQVYKFVLKTSADVLLATWDQIAGINYNFVNYVAESEVQTATASQTVFVLTSMTYTPGTNSLMVYANGLNKYEGIDYTETNGTTVTFATGLSAGTKVKFTVATQITCAATDASVVTYQPPFVGSVDTTVEDKLAQIVSVKDFGAVGDGIVDDTVAIQAALNSGAAEVCVPDGTYLHDTLTLPTGVWLVGHGGILKAKATRYQILTVVNSQNSAVKNLIFDATSLTSTLVTDEKSCISTPVGGVTLTNFVVDGCQFLNIPTGIGQRIHAIQLTYGQATVTNNYTQQSGGDIYNFNDGYFIVTNNIAENSGDGGIAFNNDARGVIANNYIYKCDIGIGAGPEGSVGDDDHSLIISSNEIVACGDGINMGWFAFVNRKGPRNVKIVGNTISKCKRIGMRYDGDVAAWTAYLSIVGNAVYDGGSTDYDGVAGTGFGIVLGGCKYSLIECNTLHDNLGTDIIVSGFENVEILGNAINAGAYTDIGGSAIDFQSTNSRIANNTIFGRRVLIQNCQNVQVADNTFTLGLLAANQGGVVVAATASNVGFSGNTFANCGNAIYLQNLSAWFANDVYESNKFVSCAVNVVSSPLPREGDAYTESYYIGTVDGSNNFDITHNLGSTAPHTVVNGTAFIKGFSGEALPLTLAFVDGTKARFTGGTSGNTARGYLRINKNAPAW